MLKQYNKWSWRLFRAHRGFLAIVWVSVASLAMPLSAMAVNLLAKAGFKNVYNITDGVEGDAVKDPNSIFVGQRLVNGWKNSGLPWTYHIKPERMLLPAANPTGK